MSPGSFRALSPHHPSRTFSPTRLSPAELGLRRRAVLRPGRSAWFELGFGSAEMCGHPHPVGYDRVRFSLGAAGTFTDRLWELPLTLACGVAVTALVRPPFPASTGRPQ